MRTNMVGLAIFILLALGSGLSEQEPPYEVVVLTPQKRQLRWAQSDDLKALFGLRVSNSVNK